MNESSIPELSKKLNKELEEAGMPEELEPVHAPRNMNSATGILLELVPEIAESLGRFKLLNYKIQEDILADLKTSRDTGIPPYQILERLRF